MQIKHYVQKIFETADAYAVIDSVEKRLFDNSFLVVLEEDLFKGILTPSDIIESPHRIVFDCLHDKPRIECEQDIESVLEIMKESRNSVLPVFDGDVFIGAITKATITDFLFEYHNGLERIITERTAELMKSNKQLRMEIEEHRLSMEKLEESEKLSRTLSENIPVIVYRMFIREKNRMRFFNDMLVLMTGYRADELTKGGLCSIEHLIIPEDRQKVIATIKKAVIEDKIFEIEYRFRCKNGEIKYFFERGKPVNGKDGKPLHVDGIILNITKRKKIEKALRNSEEKYRAVFDTANDAIFLVAESGKFIDVNNATCNMLGYKKEELLQLSTNDIDEDFRGHEAFIKVYNGEADKVIINIKHKKKENALLPLEITRSLIKSRSQSIGLTIARDISERMRVEMEVKELNERLEQRVEARTSELLDATKKLQHRQKELLRHKLELEKVNQELIDTNNALSVLAKNIDKNRKESEKKIALTINSNMMPIIKKLRDHEMLKSYKEELDVLLAYLHDITSSLLSGNDIIIRLSPSEMRVAAMIKNGLTSHEIANKLFISLDTVKSHRKNIRKKLKIYKSNINLTNYLRQKWGEA